MINYILNRHNSNIFHLNKNENKNSFYNFFPSKKFNLNKNQSTNNINRNILKNTSPNDSKMKIKFTKNLINELYNKKNELSPEETKERLKNKTYTNSPNKKLDFNRYLSLKKLTIKNNGNTRLSLNNKENLKIKKKKINHMISLSNNTNITNNNITTNFTNSINNTVASISNNNSNYKSNNKMKIKQKKEIKINIKVLYKDKFYNFEMNQFNNGLWLSKKINEYFNICLNDNQIHALAKELTTQINNIIFFIINSKKINDFGTIIDINKIIKENKIKSIENRYKIGVRYNKEKYYFFVNNKNEDINDMVNIIINNIIKTEKYDSLALKNEIIKKLKISFEKQNNQNHINTDFNF